MCSSPLAWLLFLQEFEAGEGQWQDKNGGYELLGPKFLPRLILWLSAVRAPSLRGWHAGITPLGMPTGIQTARSQFISDEAAEHPTKATLMVLLHSHSADISNLQPFRLINFYIGVQPQALSQTLR